MASHYANYIYEREGKSILEDEFGFATYLFTGEHCYIEDIYVASEHRRGRHATRYLDEISRIALQNGYSKLLGSVNIKLGDPVSSLYGMCYYGFKPISTEKNMIYFEKLLKEKVD